MCGINGIISFDNASRFKETVGSMNDCLAHRGPDGKGLWNDDNVVLGHRRLAIIDLSSAGLQPMFSRDNRYALIFNGEIYNYLELKKELKDYSYTNHSDTEVILSAFIKWGSDCVNHLNGMFAFAIYDSVSKELFIARDRMGIKPLYYYAAENLLVFSSEMRSLLASNLVPRKISQASLKDFIRYQTVHAPATILQNVNMLMPGQYMKVSRSVLTVESNSIETYGALSLQKTIYWNQNTTSFSNSPVGKSKKDIHKDIHDLLSKAVERRLVSDVPFGAFLSGGIDSSAIVGLMSQIHTQPVSTFSVIFNEKEFSESPYSKLVAKRFSTDHHEIHLTPDQFLEMLPDALNAMDHPSGDGPNTWVVSKMTKEAGITMALSGLGGDELFAGYPNFKRLFRLNNLSWIAKIPLPLRERFAEMLNISASTVRLEKLKSISCLPNFQFHNTYPLSRCTLPDNRLRHIMQGHNHFSNNVEEIILGLQDHQDDKHFLSYISKAELSTYLQNTLLRDTDQMSMAHPLEVRVPFLDHELIEYVLQVEDKFKFPHSPKQLLVESLSDLLPNEIVHRKKMGFTFPWDLWMKNELKSFCEQNLFNLSEYDIIHSEYLNLLWDRFLNGDALVPWSRMWPLLVLGKWLKDNKIETSV